MTDPDLKAEYWTMYVDGLSVAGIRGVGVIIFFLEKDVLRYGIQL